MRDADDLFLPGFEPPPPTTQELEQIERLVEGTVAYIHMLRPNWDGDGPINRDDIARCRQEAIRLLRGRLPIPSDQWLDEFIIELAGWWFEFPLADDVPPPKIDVAPDQPRKPRDPSPAYDGVEVGWVPWMDPWDDDD
jgi:hypothetical protein